MRKFTIATMLAGVLALSPATAMAASFAEVGDAGELVGTAQSTVGIGALTSITGSLVDLGAGAPIDDIDLYRIKITDADAFSVSVSATLSIDNDAQLFVFTETGSLVFFSDDFGGSPLPGAAAGDLTGNAPGTYLLAFDLFSTVPDGDPLTAWIRAPGPFQTGPYELTLTGAAFDVAATETPEPATLAVLGLGLCGLAALRRRKG